MINPDYTLFVQFFQILVLLIILKLFLFKPILNHLAKRRSAITDLADQAEGKKGEAESLSGAYAGKLEEKRLPILAEKEAQLKGAHAASMKIIEEARKELAVELAKVRESVKTEGRKTLDALIGESDRLALEIATKITGRSA